MIELLGRTGEPKPDRPVQLALKHRDFKEPVQATLKTDAAGRVNLGPLADIVSVTRDRAGRDGAHLDAAARSAHVSGSHARARPARP